MPRKSKTVGLPVAVIDNTLLSRLAELGLAKLLPYIFKQIRIPPEVKREAYRGGNKRRLRNLLNENNGFFIDCWEADIVNKEILKTIVDKGEAAVIAQAEATNSVVITDDDAGRKQAQSREIEVFRTGKILCLLKEAKAISLVEPYLDVLVTKMGFRLLPKAKEAILKLADEI
jgi:predicted nucleic acid-binding protein